MEYVYISTSRSPMDIILVSICGFVRALIFNMMVLGQYNVKVIVCKSSPRSSQAQSWVTFHISTYRRAANINLVSIYEFVCAQSVNKMVYSQYNNKFIIQGHLQGRFRSNPSSWSLQPSTVTYHISFSIFTKW